MQLQVDSAHTKLVCVIPTLCLSTHSPDVGNCCKQLETMSSDRDQPPPPHHPTPKRPHKSKSVSNQHPPETSIISISRVGGKIKASIMSISPVLPAAGARIMSIRWAMGPHAGQHHEHQPVLRPGKMGAVKGELIPGFGVAKPGGFPYMKYIYICIYAQ